MNLTPREQQMMGLILLWPALSDAAYAGLLGVKRRTVKSYLYSIRAKLGVEGCSRYALVVKVLEVANSMRAPGSPEIVLSYQPPEPYFRSWLTKPHRAEVARRFRARRKMRKEQRRKIHKQQKLTSALRLVP